MELLKDGVYCEELGEEVVTAFVDKFFDGELEDEFKEKIRKSIEAAVKMGLTIVSNDFNWFGIERNVILTQSDTKTKYNIGRVRANTIEGLNVASLSTPGLPLTHPHSQGYNSFCRGRSVPKICPSTSFHSAVTLVCQMISSYNVNDPYFAYSRVRAFIEKHSRDYILNDENFVDKVCMSPLFKYIVLGMPNRVQQDMTRFVENAMPTILSAIAEGRDEELESSELMKAIHERAVCHYVGILPDIDPKFKEYIFREGFDEDVLMSRYMSIKTVTGFKGILENFEKNIEVSLDIINSHVETVIRYIKEREEKKKEILNVAKEIGHPTELIEKDPVFAKEISVEGVEWPSVVLGEREN